MNNEIVLGRWGDFELVLDVSHKRLEIVSPEEIVEDRYENPTFPFEINMFTKVRKVSFFQNGSWVYVIRERKKLEEIARKLQKRGLVFTPNPELQKFFSASKGSMDIDVPVTDIVPA